tara:strand:+ start:122 stop:310 length:189 start_codon:yes stop_codon:yes gene_type:complete
MKKQHLIDQSGKGVILGAIVSFLGTTDLDPTVQGAAVTIAAVVLAWLSTLIGDKTIASFLAK